MHAKFIPLVIVDGVNLTRAVSSPLGQFVVGLRLQSHAQTLDAYRIAGTVEQHTSDPDAGIIAVGHKPWKEIELPVLAAYGSRIEDTLHLVRIVWPRLHDHAGNVSART